MSVLTQTLRSDHAETHVEFLKLYPIVERHARIVFRARPAQEREEAVADVVAGAFVSYVRLKAQGKDPVADFPSAMATYAALHVKDDRRVGRSVNFVKDWTSRTGTSATFWKKRFFPRDSKRTLAEVNTGT